MVINEFMADNDTIMDPAGETDDCIELRNNTTASVALDGFFLSDDPSVPAKWRFPDGTTIPANGYLVVWADNDSGQQGLHANFALAAGGESIRLSDADTTVLDTITFGPQITNRSLARIPDGIGNFLPARPTIGASNNGSVIVDPALTTTILPQVIEGLNGTNTNRIPFAYRGRITGLLPGATYRYINQVVTSADAATANGAGNCIFAGPTGDFVRTTGPSIATAGAHGTFTTDPSGTYEGWFITEPSGNARFVPGRFIFMRISLNDGGSGTTVDVRLTSADSVRVVKLDPGPGDSTGTGLRCTSLADPRDFVFAWDNTAGTGRPVTGSFVETVGTANTTGNNYAAFYGNSVNDVDGAFGIVLPNLLPTGVRRFERRSGTTGELLSMAADEDGVWPSGASTVNPSGGTTEVVLTGTDVSLVTGVSPAKPIPAAFALRQNYPNPFNPSTSIAFDLPADATVALEVFDVIGRPVTTLLRERRSAGTHVVTFDAGSLPSGIYFYRLTAGSAVSTRRMALIK